MAPVLSAQFMTAATGRAIEMWNLPPDAPPRPRLDIFADLNFFQILVKNKNNSIYSGRKPAVIS